VFVEAGSPGKRVVLDYLRARQTRDLQLLDRVVTSDFSHEMMGERQDRASLFAEVESLPFVDARFEVDALVEEGDQVACRYRFFAETSAGRPIAFSGMFIATLRDGRLASGWGEYDAARLRRQLDR
jgi:predicted ester cyclase